MINELGSTMFSSANNQSRNGSNSFFNGQNSTSNLKGYSLIEAKKILDNEFSDPKLINMALYKLSKNSVIT
jgi:hypothetical protein